LSDFHVRWSSASYAENLEAWVRRFLVAYRETIDALTAAARADEDLALLCRYEDIADERGDPSLFEWLGADPAHLRRDLVDEVRRQRVGSSFGDRAREITHEHAAEVRRLYDLLAPDLLGSG